METGLVRKLIFAAALACTILLHIPAAQATPPLVLGYFTNWGIYWANYTPDKIPAGVDEVLYAFEMVGDCDPLKPQKENNYSQASSCQARKNDKGITIFSGTQDYQLHTTDAWSDFCSYKPRGDQLGGKCTIAKTLNANKPVVLSIGGWTLSAAIRGAIQPANATGFINSIIQFLKNAQKDASDNGISNQPFAGVDIDWEPNSNLWTLPSPPAPSDPKLDPGFVQVTVADLTNYKNFLTQLKTALTANGYSTLTIAMTANPDAIADVESKSPGFWKSLATAGVQLNLMTYDYNGQGFAAAGCAMTEFNSPLYSDTANPCPVKNFDLNDSVLALKAANVPPANIGVGIPAYGRAWAIGNKVPADNPYVPYVPKNYGAVMNVAVPAFGDIWTYREIMSGRSYGTGKGDENTTWVPVTQYVTPSGKQPVQSVGQSYVNYSTPAFISYSGFADAQNVMTYAVSNGLAGVMVWELDGDVTAGDLDYNGALLNVSTTSVVSGLASKKQ